jgi:hypothetical protein
MQPSGLEDRCLTRTSFLDPTMRFAVGIFLKQSGEVIALYEGENKPQTENCVTCRTWQSTYHVFSVLSNEETVNRDQIAITNTALQIN